MSDRDLTADIIDAAARLDRVGAPLRLTTSIEVASIEDAAHCLRFARQHGTATDADVLRRLTAALENRIVT